MDLWNWDEASSQEVPPGNRLSAGTELAFYFPELALQGDPLTAETSWEGLPQLDWGPELPQIDAPWGTEPALPPLAWSADWTDLARLGWDPRSPASQALGPAPPDPGASHSAGSEGPADADWTCSARGATSWSHAPAAGNSRRWDCSVGPDGATCWGKGLGREPRVDYTISWGGPAGSDCTNSRDLGPQTACTASSQRHQNSGCTSSEPSQQSDRATLTCCPKTNHRGGAAVGRAQEEAGNELREAEPRPALLLPPRHRAQERWAQVHVPLRGLRARPGLARPRGGGPGAVTQ
ncbi:ETS translocation variant 2 isoform X2 [Choloepus didactylus]|uniref:ETS translocation variant 2 isoform X2 n=1 Tax=Choloepus didactylus TaxID=27675 RepID=UPI00189D957E|nr:ETS translocation variant 2 isoform X2 [Choloepus didactylus]